MGTALEQFAQVKESAEEVKSDSEQRFPVAASFGDYWRQGDVYLTLLERVPNRFERSKLDRQLAPGTTKGSRHIISHDDVEMYRQADSNALTGPVIKTDKEVTVEHPEHGNVLLPPGIYGVTYQRAFAEEIRRVAD